ncbi:unnamed protein product, partial [Mesorhabditis spiculigera]
MVERKRKLTSAAVQALRTRSFDEKRLPSQRSTNSQETREEQPFYEQCSPSSDKELAVNPAKIAEVVEFDGEGEALRNSQNDAEESSEEQNLIEFLKHGSFCTLDNSEPENRKKVLIVEQLPAAFIKAPHTFRAAVKPYLGGVNSLVAFILPSITSTYELCPRRFFTPDFMRENRIEEISFKPIAVSYIVPVLTRLAKQFRINVSKTELQKLAQEANGDIRSALNTFDFTYVSKAGEPTQNMPDLQLDTFRVVGRILYAKRVEDTPKNQRIEERVRAELRRPPLERDLDELFLLSGLPDNQVSLYLHEHTPTFAPSISALSSICDILAYCDTVQPLRYDDLSRMFDRQLAYISASAVMFYNYPPHKWKHGSGGYTFNKSKWVDLSRLKDQLHREATSVAIPEETGTIEELFTLRIPLQKAVGPPLDAISFRSIGYLGRPMNCSWKEGREAWETTARQSLTYLRDSASLPSQRTNTSSANFCFDIEEDSD